MQYFVFKAWCYSVYTAEYKPAVPVLIVTFKLHNFNVRYMGFLPRDICHVTAANDTIRCVIQRYAGEDQKGYIEPRCRIGLLSIIILRLRSCLWVRCLQSILYTYGEHPPYKYSESCRPCLCSRGAVHLYCT